MAVTKHHVNSSTAALPVLGRTPGPPSLPDGIEAERDRDVVEAAGHGQPLDQEEPFAHGEAHLRRGRIDAPGGGGGGSRTYGRRRHGVSPRPPAGDSTPARGELACLSGERGRP